MALVTVRLPWCLRQYSTCLQRRRPGFNPWVRKIPWRKKWWLTQVFLSGEFHGQRSLVGYSPGGCKESDLTGRLILSWWLSASSPLSSSSFLASQRPPHWTYIYLWPIHIDVWQKTTKFYKAIILQLKNKQQQQKDAPPFPSLRETHSLTPLLIPWVRAQSPFVPRQKGTQSWSRQMTRPVASPLCTGSGVPHCSSNCYKFDLLLHKLFQDLGRAMMKSRKRQTGWYWEIGNEARMGVRVAKSTGGHLKGIFQVKMIRIKYT